MGLNALTETVGARQLPQHISVEVAHTSRDSGMKEALNDSVTSHTAMTLDIAKNHMTLGFSNPLSLK
jgi:hypothetical protein